jgi:uncharacterized protein (DUF433 family)
MSAPARPSTAPITDFGRYLETDHGDIFIAGTRIGLWQIIRAYEAGESPEQIAFSFPALELTQIYAAITYYLANREIFQDSLAERVDTQDALANRLRSRLAHRYQVVSADNRVRLISA